MAHFLHTYFPTSEQRKVHTSVKFPRKIIVGEPQSGKTTAALYELLWRLNSSHPYAKNSSHMKIAFIYDPSDIIDLQQVFQTLVTDEFWTVAEKVGSTLTVLNIFEQLSMVDFIPLDDFQQFDEAQLHIYDFIIVDTKSHDIRPVRIPFIYFVGVRDMNSCALITEGVPVLRLTRAALEAKLGG